MSHCNKCFCRFDDCSELRDQLSAITAERDALKARIEQNQEPAGVLVGELWYEGSKPEDWTFDVRPLYADPIPSPDTKEIIRKAREDALPDGWILDKSHVNDIQEKSIAALINRSKQAHFVDVKVRVNGEWETYQADWIKHMKEIK